MARQGWYLFASVILWQVVRAGTLPTESMSIVAVRTNEHMTIDGNFTEAVWQGPAFSGILQQEPEQGNPPSQRSEIRLAYDDGAVYLAARFHDTGPDSIVARLVRRDFIWGDPSDGCVLYLDPYHDHRNAYFFYVSAAGTLADGVIENDMKQPNDVSWDAVWDGAARVDSDGWSVEMKIPFSQLRFREGRSQVWGVNVERYISRRNETDMIAYTPRNDSRFVSRFPDMVGIEGVTPSGRFEALPYVTAKAERFAMDRRDPFRRWDRYIPGAGLDLKAGLSSSLTLDATINPDFCQVETDPANLNLTDIETLYEERRPFFTEGLGIFRFGEGGTSTIANFNWTPPNIFYSRRIGRVPQRGIASSDPAQNYYADVPAATRILGAGKISGQLGNDWKIGAIVALTNREQARIEQDGVRSTAEIEPATTYALLRAHRDFNAGMQGIGMLTTYTGRAYDDPALRGVTNSRALVAAADGFTFLDGDKTYVLSAWGAVSAVAGSRERMIALQRSGGHYFQRPDASHLGVDSFATALNGAAGRFILNKNRGRLTFNTALGFISPGFEVNDLGSSAFSDLINMHLMTSYRWVDPTEYYQSIAVNAATFASFDFGGTRTSQAFYAGGSIVLPTYYGANVSGSYYLPSYSARLTRGGPLTRTPVTRQLNVSAFTDNRESWVFNAGGSVRTGDAAVVRSVFANAEAKVTTTLTLSVGPSFTEEVNRAQFVGSFADPSAFETFGRQYLFARLDRTTLAADLRADWILNPKLSVQLYVQPYVSTGHYTGYKTLDRPREFAFTPYSFAGDLDFEYVSLRGNAVLRWEYMPGSVFYLVWTQSRLDDQYGGDFQWGDSVGRMFQARPDNIFMAKISYWLGM